MRVITNVEEKRAIKAIKYLLVLVMNMNEYIYWMTRYMFIIEIYKYKYVLFYMFVGLSILMNSYELLNYSTNFFVCMSKFACLNLCMYVCLIVSNMYFVL